MLGMTISKPGERPSRVTVRQVAREAGVSIATVSRVLNGHADVAEETRLAVRRVIRASGYGRRPGPVGPPGTGLVGVTTPVLHPGYFAEILSGAAEELYEHGLRAVLCPTMHSRARELSLIERLAGGETDGAILILPEESGAELASLAGFPLVVVDPMAEIPDGIAVVCASHSFGATQATAHLLELGHRRIGVIAGPAGWLATRERLRGYHAAMAGAGAALDPGLVRHADFRLDGGRAAARELLGLPVPPTAIFAFNDAMAIGAMQAAAGLGLAVPADVSVVGFDDTSEAAVCVPALTTVRQPLAEMGRTAVGLLLRQLANRRFEPLRVELETRLVSRDSAVPPAGH
jgi:LacI family transcriptional regulator